MTDKGLYRQFFVLPMPFISSVAGGQNISITEDIKIALDWAENDASRTKTEQIIVQVITIIGKGDEE
uniref:Uncharacterized protein n=1 Tax=viral metagenome TaxID=1070528 RepID=A0A6M3Y587_9ZZZZ